MTDTPQTTTARDDDLDELAYQIAQNYPIEAARIKYLLYLAEGDETLVRKALDCGAPLGSGRYSLVMGRQPDMADMAAQIIELIRSPAPVSSSQEIADRLRQAATTR